MSERDTQIATICECIDSTFSYFLWCEDFVAVIAEDIIYVDKASDVISHATLLHSFLALRKLDDFFGAVPPKIDDLAWDRLGLNKAAILGGARTTLLDKVDRMNINKGVAHMTEKLTLGADSEVDLLRIIENSICVFERLICELRKIDVDNEAKHCLDNTEEFIQRIGSRHE